MRCFADSIQKFDLEMRYKCFFKEPMADVRCKIG
jgi:hypothetical protein